MKHNKIIFVFILFCLLLSGCKKECVHEYQSQISQPASCTQEGVETFTCALCQNSYTKPVPVLEHSYAPSKIEKEPTCSEEGLQKYACTHCGVTKSEPIETLAHTFGKLTVTKEPNCTEEGERSGTCTVCGTNQVVEKIAINDVHVFTNTVIREATCTDPGEGINTCSLCQYSESCQYELRAHTYGNEEIIANATCTNAGTKQFVCTGCGHTVTETIAATGHKWTGATCTTAATCSVCQATGHTADHAYIITYETQPKQSYAGHRVQKCQTCGKDYTLYYTNRYIYDLDKILNELMDYGRALGFNVVNDSTDTVDRRVALGVFELEIDKGPDKFLERGKSCIKYLYDTYSATPAGISVYTAHITVTYGENTTAGGIFGINVSITS